MIPVSQGKPCAGNPHARFEEGASASEEPRRSALLHKRIMLMGLVLALAGCGASEPSNRCGTSEPSNKEIAQGMIQSFVRETGIPSSNLKAKAKKIGNGRWAVSMEAERYNGERRTLNATAVMDKNGDIHYYTD